MKTILLLLGLLSANLLTAAERVELSAITLFSPKGRVQDKDYNPNQPVIDSLIAQGTNSIPLLINLLDNDTLIDHQVINYWPSQTIGDLAFVILTDLTTGIGWTNTTIPGASWNEMLGSKPDPNILLPAFNQLVDFKKKHGSKELKRRWQKLWAEHHNRIYWDARARCFKLKSR
jgi:hypothetical protein